MEMSRGKVLFGLLGIVVHSPSLEVLRVNRQAHLLISDLLPTTSEAQQPNNRTDVLPSALINLSHEILSLLRSCRELSEKWQFEIRHSANESGKLVVHSRSGSAEWTWSRACAHRARPNWTSANHSEDQQSLGSGL